MNKLENKLEQYIREDSDRIQTVETNFRKVIKIDEKKWIGTNSGLQGPKGDKGDRGPTATMPHGRKGFVEFTTKDNQKLHIGPGGVCLYDGSGTAWCRSFFKIG